VHNPPRISRIRYVLRLRTDEPAQRMDLLRRNLEHVASNDQRAATYRALAPGARAPPPAERPHPDFTQELPRKLLPTRAKESQTRRREKR
jgi:hypothetical protein